MEVVVSGCGEMMEVVVNGCGEMMEVVVSHGDVQCLKTNLL